MSREWTINQEKAIQARGMQVLVSAAAGSGKTSVLTERVKNILSDTENPCSVSELLVVTFTRAAATEMRDRISDALKEAVSIDEENADYLRRQILLLPTADICTIDSFCSKIVRENFSLAGVGVDYKLLDEKDSAQMMEECLSGVIDELYAEDDEAFRALTTMFLSERDDKLLGEVILTLYNYSRSYPSPGLWLRQLAESFDSNKTPNETIWADVVYKYLALFSDFHYSRLMRCVALMEEAGNFSPDYLRRFTATAENVHIFKTYIENKDWDGMVQAIRNGLPVKVPARNSKVDEALKKLTQEVFTEFEDDVKNLEKHTLPTIAEHKEDSEKLYPIVNKLCDAVEKLTRTLDETKKENNTYSFDDILHKCIDLLVEFQGDRWTLKPVAKALRSKYKEILIDEYQDTNEAQNMIFEALSHDCENLYCVGDVKQSIYRFRLASPDLFMNLRRNLGEYDGEKHPSQITLDKNFRSRKGIDDAVNFVFKKLMSTDVGEIDYDEREELSFGATYYPEKTGNDTQIICVYGEGLKAAEATALEAEVVAEYIEKLLESKVKISAKGGERPLCSSDICVLLRSVKNKAQVYTAALKNRGIPSSALLEGDIGESKEIMFLASLVKVINNPLIDIPLIAVLMSPVFGFTADELAEIRMIDRKSELFVCLEKYAKESPKAEKFIEKFNLYRNASSSLPVDEFIRFIVNDTAVGDIYSAAGEGEIRRCNIRGFLKFAEDFSLNGRTGLGAFVRYLDNAIKNGSLKSYGVSSGEGVQFMSIHKSKGLEFPYVIVADCSKGFNKQDSHKSMTLARETGIGLRIRDDELFTRYHTVSSAATEKAILFGGASEELRVLYVAMTRAKEHLTFICTVTGKSLGKRVRMNNILSTDKNGRLHPYAVYRANSMSEWLLSSFASHKDCKNIRDICAFECADFTGFDFGVDDVCFSEPLLESTEENIPEAIAQVDLELLKEIEDRAAFKYEYDCSGLLAKVTASSTEHNKTQRAFFAKSKPHFLDGAFTGADRGNAIHKFFELCDFKAASTDPIKEKDRLCSTGLMTEKELEVLSTDSVENFFNSDVGRRLVNSSEIFKEYEFAFLKKAGDVNKDIPDNIKDEKIVVQGKLDCAFIENGEAVLIDYKSDNITDENVYRTLYAPQLEVYAEALKECTGYKVKEKYLYSFKLQKFIAL